LIGDIKMHERKSNDFKTPDITKMQEVVINYRTKIYIAVGADPEEARTRFLDRQKSTARPLFAPKKTS